MAYIFGHEKLRNDEIMRRVSAKNNFTPLKPLRSSNLNLRKNNITYIKNKKNTLSLSITNRQRLYSESQSKSPLSPQFLSHSGHKSYKKAFSDEFSKYHLLKATVPIFENPIKPLCQDKEINKALPVINKAIGLNNQKTKDIKNENTRKNSQSLIAYVPTVAYVNDKEDFNENQEFLVGNLVSRPLKSFLQSNRVIS
ncbi:hypothetical protein SteCoe_2353 [Stentor coeruleus]|uniref:Uncharacterized protein n=1 Tax=Stentor coeruleus TaxID=5963 RepID=A0A1R2CZM7_9CILI|nr:hypothetical protein SteCoe_2353 [Stentor coeruleus]